MRVPGRRRARNIHAQVQSENTAKSPSAVSPRVTHLGQVVEAQGAASGGGWGFEGCEDNGFALLRNSVSQMVYKHAISTVVPARNVRLPTGEDGEVTEPAIVE